VVASEGFEPPKLTCLIYSLPFMVLIGGSSVSMRVVVLTLSADRVVSVLLGTQRHRMGCSRVLTRVLTGALTLARAHDVLVAMRYRC
jgi:hypothetical protein